MGSSDRRRPLRVAVIGAGFGGLAAAVKLRQQTTASFTIFEQADGVGGTWWVNRYPGCEVDVHSHAYSFSFLKYQWLRTHATQPELLAYAEHVANVFGLRDHLRLSTRVTNLTWEEDGQYYVVSTDRGEDLKFDAVICALGLLSTPRYPEWPGLESFRGPCFHTSRWEDDHDLFGKTVAIVGTGSTAVQIVPAIAAHVKQLYVYQREPGWIEPKHERSFTLRELWVYRNIPLAQRIHRAWIFVKSLKRFQGLNVASSRQGEMRVLCTDFIRDAIADPATRAAVTPGYPWGCKRPVVASTFYPALNRPNVELVPHAVTSVTEDSIVDETGTRRKADVLILSTGFQPTNFLASLEVKGRDGRSIRDAWSQRPSAFLGITVAGFPNLFILYGPNTNGGLSIIAQLERQAEVAVRAIRRMQDGARSVDTRPAAQRAYVRWIDWRLARHASATESGCRNYYHVAGGANVTQWPGTHFLYAVVTRLFARFGLVFR